jgi:hypothetical protein
MDDEMNNINKMKTWTLVSLPLKKKNNHMQMDLQNETWNQWWSISI